MSPASVPIATIDGPSSSGKGTISRIVASKVGWNLLDSGALYRLVAMGGILRNLDPDDVEEHVAVARSMRVEFGSVGTGEERVLLDGKDVTQKVCGATCHGPDIIMGNGRTRDQWTGVVNSMIARGT